MKIWKIIVKLLGHWLFDLLLLYKILIKFISDQFSLGNNRTINWRLMIFSYKTIDCFWLFEPCPELWKTPNEVSYKQATSRLPGQALSTRRLSIVNWSKKASLLTSSQNFTQANPYGFSFAILVIYRFFPSTLVVKSFESST